MSSNRFDSKSIPEEFKKYILYNKGFYIIRNNRNSIFITFGRFSSKDVACAATKLLIKYDWNIRKIDNDLVSEYQEKFYVFKEIDNTLIFDSKFASYEDAVEYSEINHKCNDYHNNIFKNKSEQKTNSDRYDSSDIDSSTCVSDNHIFEEKDKFIVKKSKSEDSFIFGEFDSLEVALAARKILLESNWELDNQYEFSFYDNHYWVFEVYGNKLLFKGKSKIYEDAWNIITPSKIETEEKYPHSISDNNEGTKKRKDTTEKSETKLNLIVKKNGDVIRIWYPPYKKIVQKDIPPRIFVQNCSKTGNKFFILEFNYLLGNIQCIVTRMDIKWQKKQVIDAKNFPEFKLIIRILKTYGCNMPKIKNSSSIYFYNNLYYKIHIIKNNTIVFDSFTSYNQAEKAILKCKKIRKIPSNNKCPSEINKLDDNYELVKFKDGNTYKVNGLNSLEKIKIIRDILILSNWDFDIFDEYDLFYLNGIYWELNRQGNTVNLIDQFESIAI